MLRETHEALLARANPLAKLAAIGMLTVALAVTVDWVSAVVALGCMLFVVPLSGLSLPGLIVRAWPLLIAALIGAWGTALSAADGGAMLLDLGYLSITEGSLAAGLAIGCRGLAIALPAVILMASTDPTDLADALAQRARLPHRFVLGALAAMRLVGLMAEEWRTLGMARRARGVGSHGGFGARLRANAGQGFSLLVQAVRRASRLAVTMEAKGFGGGPRTWARESTYSLLDLWVVLGGAAVAVLATSAAIAAGSWNFIWS